MCGDCVAGFMEGGLALDGHWYSLPVFQLSKFCRSFIARSATSELCGRVSP